MWARRLGAVAVHHSDFARRLRCETAAPVVSVGSYNVLEAQSLCHNKEQLDAFGAFGAQGTAQIEIITDFHAELFLDEASRRCLAAWLAAQGRLVTLTSAGEALSIRLLPRKAAWCTGRSPSHLVTAASGSSSPCEGVAEAQHQQHGHIGRMGAEGTLSTDELRRALCGVGLKNADVNKIYKVMDTNSDERVSYTEFIRWLFHGGSEATVITKKVFGGPSTPAEAMAEFMEFIQELKDTPPAEGEKPTKLKDIFKKLDGLTGSAWGDWANYADSPLRASTQDVLFKGGAGSVDGGMGAGSFGGAAKSSSSSSSASVLGWLQILWFIGLIEGSGFFSGKYGLGFMKDATMSGTPGDYGVGFPTFLGKVSDPAAKKSKLQAELANGRLTGSAWGDWANYADSPLRASTQDVLFKGGAGSVDGGMGAGSFGGAAKSSSSSSSASVSTTTLGVQAPTGYWDPLGLNANADAATFNRRRAVEIKHGRVAMYATMGYIVPEYYKFPGGYLSPSLGLKFSDVPSGLAAISKVPVLGWLQILWFIGLIEGSGFFSGKYGLGFMKDATMSGTPGDYGVGFPTFLGKVSDPAAKKSKLQAELANGRLTGSAWGDWANYADSPLRASTQDVLFKGGAGSVDGGMGAGSFGGAAKSSSSSSSASVLGWLQILWFIGLIEGSGFFSGKYGLGFMKDATMSGTPGDYGVGFPTFLGKVSDPAAKKSKLQAELANGRLAMMAIIGMFFQDGFLLGILVIKAFCRYQEYGLNCNYLSESVEKERSELRILWSTLGEDYEKTFVRQVSTFRNERRLNPRGMVRRGTWPVEEQARSRRRGEGGERFTKSRLLCHVAAADRGSAVLTSAVVLS
eukprot:Skav224238  [mRNA]  locus=scaffold939:1285377:1313197:+ [translate_table: standard]